MSAPDSPASFNRRQRWALFLIAGLSGVIGAFLFLRAYPHPDDWRGLMEAALELLQAHPWALLLALATLPGVGFPISPLFILVGITIGPRYGMPTACLLGIAAQSICMTWTYLLAAGPLRQVISNFVRKRRALPTLTEGNMWRLALILRITPGIPFALQNPALGILGMRLGPYLLVSVPIGAAWAVGFIVTGGAVFAGRSGLAISGILLLITLILATRLYLKRKAAHV